MEYIARQASSLGVVTQYNPEWMNEVKERKGGRRKERGRKISR